MTLAQGSAWLFYVVMAGLAMAGALSAMSFEELNRLLGLAVRKAMIDCHDMQVKEAADIMQIDRSLFEKALRGEGYRHLALNHLVKLGPEFMVHLTRHLMWLTAQERYVEIVEALRVRRQA